MSDLEERIEKKFREKMDNNDNSEGIDPSNYNDYNNFISDCMSGGKRGMSECAEIWSSGDSSSSGSSSSSSKTSKDNIKEDEYIVVSSDCGEPCVLFSEEVKNIMDKQDISTLPVTSDEGRKIVDKVYSDDLAIPFYAVKENNTWKAKDIGELANEY